MKDAFRRFCVLLVGLMLSIFIHIIVMIKGWGLDPKSYFWIIVVSLVGQITAQLFIRAAGD